MASFFPFVLLNLLAVYTTYGLICYKCNSQDNVSCKTNITLLANGSEACVHAGVLDSGIGPKCFKITGETTNGTVVIVRGCLPPATVGCFAIASVVGWISSQTSIDSHVMKSLYCHTCDTDKCNSI